jgi:hypothetical protein
MLHNKEFHNLNSSSVIRSRRMICSAYGEMRNAYSILVRKPVGMGDLIIHETIVLK